MTYFQKYKLFSFLAALGVSVLVVLGSFLFIMTGTDTPIKSLPVDFRTTFGTYVALVGILSGLSVWKWLKSAETKNDN